jgi:hypothetical protein
MVYGRVVKFTALSRTRNFYLCLLSFQLYLSRFSASSASATCIDAGGLEIGPDVKGRTSSPSPTQLCDELYSFLREEQALKFFLVEAGAAMTRVERYCPLYYTIFLTTTNKRMYIFLYS